MGRRRIELSPTVEAEIAARAARGESVDRVTAALGGQVSRSTIARKLADLRSGATQRAPARAAAPSAEAAVDPQPWIESAEASDVPDAPPEGTSLEQLNAWITRLEKAADAAEKEGKLPALASIASKVTALMALRHKSAPLPKQDPNVRPDYVELARKGEERLLKLIRGTFKEHGRVPSP